MSGLINCNNQPDIVILTCLHYCKHSINCADDPVKKSSLPISLDVDTWLSWWRKKLGLSGLTARERERETKVKNTMLIFPGLLKYNITDFNMHLICRLKDIQFFCVMNLHVTIICQLLHQENFHNSFVFYQHS